MGVSIGYIAIKCIYYNKNIEVVLMIKILFIKKLCTHNDLTTTYLNRYLGGTSVLGRYCLRDIRLRILGLFGILEGLRVSRTDE